MVSIPETRITNPKNRNSPTIIARLFAVDFIC
jgi:hypothetical protein